MIRNSFVVVVAMFTILYCATAALGQTSSFLYQGRLADGATPANGNYDLQFALWDSLSGGTQIGSTQTLTAVAVSNGVFTVSLDFGAGAFPGASRFLEIRARPAGTSSFTVLSPRQPITSTPYAVRSLNAASADSVPASGVAAGSGNYIQNTESPQTLSNFNISGNGTAGGTLTGSVVNATTQYNLNGSRILSNQGQGNLFAGVGAGAANTTGHGNAFFGPSAGNSNTTGLGNSFYGQSAGGKNTTGSINSFFGASAGVSNTVGNSNVFVGFFAGSLNTVGIQNSFFGANAGVSNAAGNNNTAIGFQADIIPGDSFNPINATAIGARAQVTDSNSLVLGSINGTNGANADTNVGIGTTAPKARLHIRANSKDIMLGDPGCGPGFIGIGFGSPLGCANYAMLGGDANTYINRPAGGNIIFREGNGPNQVEIRPGGVFAIGVLATGGSTSLCRNSVAAIATCSSSLRYKTEVKPFGGGLQLVQRLQPVSFLWKTNHQPDIGLVAEDVAQVEPRLTFKNTDGEIEGVNYSQLTAVLINAIKEQQLQIQKQQEEIEALKRLACRSHRRAAVCK